MKLCVSGATGLLGRAFIKKYNNKYDITALTRSKGNKLPCKVKITDYSLKSLETILLNCDAVLHLAAGRPNNTKKEELVNNVKVDTTFFLAAQSAGVKNIVFSSTRGVYGQQPTPWTEKTNVVPESIYSLSKVQSELAASYYNSIGMHIKVLRLSQLYTIGEYAGSVTNMFINNALLDKEIRVTVTGINREYTYISDIITAFDLALGKPEVKGVFNVGSGESLTIENMAKNIQDAFSRTDLIKYEENPKVIVENSWMDSSLFRKTFHWKPEYNFRDASVEIANILQQRKCVLL